MKPINNEELNSVEHICKKYGHDFNKECVKKNILSCIRAEKIDELSYGRNEKLLENKDIFSYEHFTSSPKTWACLIGWYQTPRTNKEMPSSQAAKQAQTLRNYGFVFKSYIKKDGSTTKNRTFHKDGKEYREIIGFDPSSEPPYNYWNKLSNKTIKILKSVHKKDFLGNSCAPKEKEFDHRITENVRRNENIVPIKLTEELVRSGEYINHFQIISRSTNDKKREACNACIKGEIIPLPPAIEPFRSAYRQTYEEMPERCVHCFYHDYLNPLKENLCPDLEFARKIRDEEVKEVIRMLNK